MEVNPTQNNTKNTFQCDETSHSTRLNSALKILIKELLRRKNIMPLTASFSKHSRLFFACKVD